MLTTSVKEAREACEDSLRGADLRRVAEALERSGVSREQCVSLVRAVDGSNGDQRPVKQLISSIAPLGADWEDGSIERFLLIQGALGSLPAVPGLPVNTAVKTNFCEAFRFFAFPPQVAKPKFLAGSASFGSMCRIAALRRFPAGEFEWEVSGLPRSWLFKVNPRSLPKLLYTVAARMNGFAPVFFPHLGVLRPKRIALLEPLINKSYYQMATSLEFQPEIKGLVTSSWFFSPEIGKVSPHLAWLGKFFVENGGLVVTMGSTDVRSGALSRSKRRRELYESGKFQPTAGLVIWPRKEMLEWAARQSELET